MKHFNLKLVKVITFSVLSVSTFAQGNWLQGGNGTFPPPNSVAIPANQLLGTTANFPLRLITNNTQRMHINQDRTQTVGGYTFNANGFIGIGQNSVAPTHPNGIWNDFGPFSILHINGFEGYDVKPSGFRPWMQAGVTMTDNNDLSYVGLRKIGTGTERTEMVIAWSDNVNLPGSLGPDDLVFRFLTPGVGNTSIAPSLHTTNDLDGRNIARFTPDGKMALGSTFGDPVEYSTYVRPASLLHMSVIQYHDAFLQITQEIGTGQTVDDGLRMGIAAGNNPAAFLRWQEQTPFIIQTDWDATAGGINNGERMRISSINASGIPNPAGLPTNTTRIAISHNGNLPLTEPRSLIHAGRNTSATGDGWRNWMDVGMFLNNGADNIYLGLKKENSTLTEAVINWGDNQTTPANNLRFIFTSPTGGTLAPANTSNGLETARISPAAATTMGVNYGMMGIGDFSPSGPNAALTNQPNAKLDIDGDLRIRTVTNDNSLEKVLVIDELDRNRVHWRNINSFGLGNNCSQPQNALTNDYEIPLNAKNFSFSSEGKGSVQIGDVYCGYTPPARLFVRNTYGFSGINVGIWSESDGIPNQTAGYFIGSKYGVFAEAHTNASSGIIAAVFANAQSNSGLSSNNWALYGNGDVLHVGGLYNPSESKLKNNIKPIEKALETIKKLEPVTFNYNTSSFPSMNLPKELEYGVLAENVAQVLPDLVKNIIHPEVLDSLGNLVHSTIEYKGVNYTELIPIAIQAINELDYIVNSKDSIINNLENRLTHLENCIMNANICSDGNRMMNNEPSNNTNNRSIELTNHSSIILDQNLPNPFAENTVINYNIPTEVMEAKLMFYDLNGRIIKELIIDERGESKLTVYGENLKTGVYTYSLIADGELIATKKMVKK